MNQSSNQQAASAAADDSRTTLFEVQKNAKERIRVCLSRYRGNEYIELRVWYVGAGGEYMPSRHGFMFKPSLLPQIMQGLQLAGRAAEPTGAR